ncbi:CYTH domain-containing protein, partial [bacterium]|nr:CYTH domain-containing protein [bacterium]
METIGDRIKLARKRCGYTQETLAKTLYFSDKAISSWENNRTKPDIKSLCVLSETLNTTIDYLLYGNKTKEKDEIELKICVTDDEYLRILNDVKVNSSFIEKIKQIDEYFIMNKENSWLRIRESKNNITLSLKRKIKDNNYSKDTVSIDNRQSMLEILTFLGYKSLGIINKERITYKYLNNFIISFDKVTELGNFIEFKSINDENNSYEKI